MQSQKLERENDKNFSVLDYSSGTDAATVPTTQLDLVYLSLFSSFSLDIINLQ